MSAAKKRQSQAKSKLRARKALSQNFLVDESIADRYAASVPVTPGDAIYEIGPGKGFITERLVASGATVWAIEKDRRLYGMLKKKFPARSGVKLFHADILNLPEHAEPPDQCWLVGNLPFGIGHAILAWAFDRRERFQGAILTLQREVVARLLAEPGSRTRSSASVWFQARATGRVLFDIPPRAFVPPPRVTSTVMWVDFTPQTPGVEEVAGIEYIVERAFAQKRKILANNLRSIASLSADDWDRLRRECGDLLQKRAEALHADEFVRLARVLHLADADAGDADHPVGGDSGMRG
jgi:16S rRNA (adenine1518-N6/adenine1519-N6)-dimethyltransferase